MSSKKTSFLSKVLLIGLFMFAMPLANAQLVQPKNTSIIESIDVEFEGGRDISKEAVLANIQIKEGMPYDQRVIDESIRSLYETGFYQFIQVRKEPMTGGGTRLIFNVAPKLRIAALIFEGQDDISEKKLRELSELEEGQSVDEVKIKKASDEIRKYYVDKDFSNITIDYKIERNEEIGTGVVRFMINEGEKLKISEIIFVGNNSIDSDDLEDVMETKERGIFSWITGTGRYKQELLEDDLQLLRDYYKDQGFLDVEIRQGDVKLDYPSGNKINITITINEGREYSIGSITISGNTLFTLDELIAELDIEQGDVFSPSKVDSNAVILKDHYGRVGYLDTIVRAQRKPNLETGNIDLNFNIRESERFYVEGINIQGNDKTKSVVLLRELALLSAKCLTWYA